MLDILSIYKNDFDSVFQLDKKEYNSIYVGIEKESKKEVLLKVYDKRLIEEGPKLREKKN